MRPVLWDGTASSEPAWKTAGWPSRVYPMGRPVSVVLYTFESAFRIGYEHVADGDTNQLTRCSSSGLSKAFFPRLNGPYRHPTRALEARRQTLNLFRALANSRIPVSYCTLHWRRSDQTVEETTPTPRFRRFLTPHPTFSSSVSIQ